MNQAGRPTLDKKDCTLKLRLNDEMRDWIERRAYEEGVSMSEYLRELIRIDMDTRFSSIPFPAFPDKIDMGE